MKLLPLSKGLFAIVDDSDFDRLNAFSWHALRCQNKFYAARTNRERKCILMHRLILGATAGVEVDHENGFPLDNRRKNLRLATSTQNKRNRIKRTALKTSKFKGVSWSTRHQCWSADITYNKKHRYIGLFNCEADAARAYDLAAINYFGEFAKTNSQFSKPTT